MNSCAVFDDQNNRIPQILVSILTPKGKVLKVISTNDSNIDEVINGIYGKTEDLNSEYIEDQFSDFMKQYNAFSSMCPLYSKYFDGFGGKKIILPFSNVESKQLSPVSPPPFSFSRF